MPNVVRSEYQLVNIDDGFLNLMLIDGTPKDDVKVPEGDIGKDIQKAFDDGMDMLVTIIAAMGESLGPRGRDCGAVARFKRAEVYRVGLGSRRAGANRTSARTMC